MRLLRRLTPSAVIAVAVTGVIRAATLPDGPRPWALGGIVVGVYVFAMCWGTFVVARQDTP